MSTSPPPGPSPENPADIAREAFKRLAVRRIAPTPQNYTIIYNEIAGIEDAYAGMKRAVEGGGDYVTYDLRFHQGLLRAAHNRMLVQMSKALSALLRTSFEISTIRKDGPKRSLPLHRAVLDAVIARNPAKAEKAILVLIDGAHEDIELVLGSRRRLPKLSNPAKQLKAA